MPRERSSIRAEAVAPTGMVAAAVNLSVRASKGKSNKIKNESWQTEVWGMYDVIPEYHYGVNWVGNLLSRAKLVILKDGKPTTDKFATAVLDSLYGGREGQSAMLKKLGVHLSVAGEAYVCGIEKAGEDDWLTLVPTKVKSDANGFEIMGERYSSSQAVVIRIWQEHPADPSKADSPSRACLPVLNELHALGKRSAAEISSRLTGNGIVWVPNEVSFPGRPMRTTNNGEESDGRMLTGAEGFVEELMDNASAAISDPDSAEAMLPIIAQVPGEFVDKINHTTFWSELSAAIPAKVEAAIRRLALGLDTPPEVLLGTADMNHWNAWQMEEAAIKATAEPFLLDISAALTKGYLRPSLEAGDAENAAMDEGEAARYGIGIDSAELRLRPNRSKEAQELYDRGAISLDVMLTENGFDPETDKMEDEELRQWFLRKVASGSTTPELVAQALLQLAVPGITAPADEAPTTEAPARPSLEDHPTNPAPDPLAGGGTDSASLAAAEVMVFRALERAGNRLKNRLGQNRPADVAAADLYQYVIVANDEIPDLLVDAFTCSTRFSIAVDPDRLESYTRQLIATRKPHDPELLSSYLRLTADAG